MARLAPSLARLTGERNFRYPKHDTWSDGWLGDTSHATRFSDHNPDASGWVHAIDLDATMQHEMGSGEIGDLLIAVLLKQARAGKLRGVAHYFIYKGRIYTSESGFAGHIYTGSNQHDSHVHISIHRTSGARAWSGLWGVSRAVDLSQIRNRESVNNDDWRVVQRGLNRVLKDNVEVDGVAGRETREAIKRLQKRLGNKQTGIPGRELIRHIGCIPIS
jgi:hypothetical protein